MRGDEGGRPPSQAPMMSPSRVIPWAHQEISNTKHAARRLGTEGQRKQGGALGIARGGTLFWKFPPMHVKEG